MKFKEDFSTLVNTGLFDIDYVSLYAMAEKLKERYKQNKPFPNIYIDDFFSPETYKNVCQTFPAPESQIWKTPSNEHTINKSVTKQGPLGLKEYMFSETQRRLFMELNSSLFLNFLERISGIAGLIPDPYFAEGSYAMSKRDGILDIHADFSHHDKLGLERRLNMLIYLNDEWLDEYDGALNLYDEELQLVKRIFPYGNRMTLFTTSEKSFHGFPDKIKCPPNMERRSINLYYYTIPRPERAIKRVLFPSDPNFTPTITRD